MACMEKNHEKFGGFSNFKRSTQPYTSKELELKAALGMGIHGNARKNENIAVDQELEQFWWSGFAGGGGEGGADEGVSVHPPGEKVQ